MYVCLSRSLTVDGTFYPCPFFFTLVSVSRAVRVLRSLYLVRPQAVRRLSCGWGLLLAIGGGRLRKIEACQHPISQSPYTCLVSPRCSRCYEYSSVPPGPTMSYPVFPPPQGPPWCRSSAGTLQHRTPRDIPIPLVPHLVLRTTYGTMPSRPRPPAC